MLGAYLARRCMATVPVLLLVTIIAFLGLALLPGDVVSGMLAAGEGPDPEIARALRSQFGLDRPLPVRYAQWVARVARGDLGRSLVSRQPVLDKIRSRLPVTLILTGGALALSLLAGIPLGLVSGLRPNSRVDRLVSATTALGMATPDFWLGILLSILFAQRLGWVPSFGYKSPLEHGLGTAALYMLLPWCTLATARVVAVARQVRSGAIDLMAQDFIRTARAKGLPEPTIWRHALPHVLIPVATTTGLALAVLLSGAVVVEQVFLLPGIGTLAVDALLARDVPVTQGIVLIGGVATVLSSLLADLTYGLLDPRVRYE
jgi:peptide/nickel transport system permease protein